jgi:phosphoribosyl 1,2-cyclic phosphate phosphodiesterase
MELTILGSGTSTGVPMIGCRCEVCCSSNPKNHRSRASAYIRSGSTRLLVDTSTDLRQQALQCGVDGVDAVLYTHAHADHVHGIDELRSFNHLQRGPIPCYGNAETIAALRERFAYAFSNGTGPAYTPQLQAHALAGPRVFGGVTVEPIEVEHGADRILGYRLGTAAYVTDCSRIPPASQNCLRGLDLLVLSAIRYDAHPTHFTLEQALEAVAALRPRRAVLTHLSHVFDYDRVTAELPEGIALAYDGMVLHV